MGDWMKKKLVDGQSALDILRDPYFLEHRLERVLVVMARRSGDSPRPAKEAQAKILRPKSFSSGLARYHDAATFQRWGYNNLATQARFVRQLFGKIEHVELNVARLGTSSDWGKYTWQVAQLQPPPQSASMPGTRCRAAVIMTDSPFSPVTGYSWP